VNGVSRVVANPAPDTLTLIDLKASPPVAVAEIPVPASVVGPPLSVAITPDESLALVTSAMKIDPADATAQVPDDPVSVCTVQGQTVSKLRGPSARSGSSEASARRPARGWRHGAGTRARRGQ
jgi:hypothetical protein